MYKNVNEIKNAFIADGWSNRIQFEELNLHDLEKIGVCSMIQKAKEGHKYFRMLFCGNVYDENGKIVLLNIPVNGR